MSTYTLFLKKENYEHLENVNMDTFLLNTSIESNFRNGCYATYTYYKQKTPKIDTVSESCEVSAIPMLTKGVLCITTSRNKCTALLLNTFHNRNNTILYVPVRAAELDTERTWNIIQEKRNLHKISTLILHMESWSKMVYAYRAATSYGITTIKDITY